jgi:hypothetical protein
VVPVVHTVKINSGFEQIGYAAGLRKLSNKALWVLVVVAAGFLIQLAVTTPGARSPAAGRSMRRN